MKGQSIAGVLGIIGGILTLLGVSTSATVYVAGVGNETANNTVNITALSTREQKFEETVNSQYAWITQTLYEIGVSQGAKISLPPQLATTTVSTL